MPLELSNNDLALENAGLQQQVSALKAEIDLLRKSILPNETYYKDRFYKINENVNDVVYRYLIKERTFEYISPQTKVLLGYNAEEFYTQKFLIRKLIHPDSFHSYKKYWRGLLTGEVPEFFEIKLIRKDKAVIWVIQKNLIIKDNADEIIAIEGILTDITDRKIAEERLIESEAQKKAIFNNLPYLAWLKNCDGIYLSVNEAFAHRMKKEVNGLIGLSDFDIYDLQDALRYQSEDRLVIKTRKKLSLEEKTKDTYWATFKAPVFNNHGEVIGVTGISQDVTEQKGAEEEIREYSEQLAVQNVKLKLINDELTKAKNRAEEADRLKSAFLANMSHEIRTPMNAILGFATLLRDRKLPEEKQNEFINLINSNCRQLLHIISDIIDISKIEANQITLFEKDFNINKALAVLKQNFESQIISSRKNLVISVQCSLPDPQAVIYTDKVRLEQILSNLLSNAIKFTEQGTVEFGYQVSANKSEIVFYVKDSGIGMTAEEQIVIFERFRQVSSAYNKQYGGTGLGLSISKGLAEKLDGRIWLKSEVEAGSTFYLSIPFKQTGKVVSEPIPFTAFYDWAGKTILIAEDEKTNYSLLENIIYPTKAKIIWVKNGIDAIEACRNEPKIDLVLMDIKMPDMNGLEATKRIKKFRKTLPIIAQTAFAMPQDADNCLRAGCDDYLAKPLGIDDILNKINKFLSSETPKPKIKPVIHTNK